jgi:hypothetical protein
VDKELQKYYDDRFSMMATQGWLDLVADLKEMQKAVDNLMSVPDEKTLFFRKGQLDIILWVLTLRDTSAKAYEQLQNSSGDASDAS